jgi:energy-converting hydrogenase Eha subunit C
LSATPFGPGLIQVFVQCGQNATACTLSDYALIKADGRLKKNIHAALLTAGFVEILVIQMTFLTIKIVNGISLKIESNVNTARVFSDQTA